MYSWNVYRGLCQKSSCRPLFGMLGVDTLGSNGTFSSIKAFYAPYAPRNMKRMKEGLEQI
jgi:hypothetical protein